MDVCETKNIDLFNKVHIFEPMKVHNFEPNISLISPISLMFNYAKPRIIDLHICDFIQSKLRAVPVVYVTAYCSGIRSCLMVTSAQELASSYCFVSGIKILKFVIVVIVRVWTCTRSQGPYLSPSECRAFIRLPIHNYSRL